MATLTEILTFPTTSKAFSAYNENNITESSSSPPRKAARLDQSTQAHEQIPQTANGLKILTIVGKSPEVDHRPLVQAYPQVLRRAITTLLEMPMKGAALNLKFSFEQISNACFIVVNISNEGLELYEMLKMELGRACRAMATTLKEAPEAGTRWMGQLIDAWSWHENRVNLLRSILHPLDRRFISQNPTFLNIRDLFLDIARTCIFDDAMIVTKLATGIKTWADEERTRTHKIELIDEDVKMEDVKTGMPVLSPSRELIRRVVKMLHAVSYYETHFLEPYSVEIGNFYSEESAKLRHALPSTTNLTALDYITHVEKRIKEEEERMKDVLDKSSWSTVLKQTEKTLLPSKIATDLAPDALQGAFLAKDIPSLTRMYALYSRVDSLEILRKAFKTHVQTSVKNIIKNESEDENMVTNLVELQSFLFQVAIEAFGESRLEIGTSFTPGAPKPEEHRSFTYAIHDGFENGFISRKKKPAEMIAKYIDMAMRKGQRSASDNDFWQELDRALGLYRYTQDKDVFRTFYERGLAKRLLLQKSASDDFEKMVIKRLRDGYDPEFGRGDEMFKDLALSKDLTKEFQASLSGGKPGASVALSGDQVLDGLSVMVLQYSSWPLQKVESKLALPGPMAQALTRFSNFYKLKQPNRKLEWNHNLATVSMAARFDSGDKEISVSLYQAVVLLLFNDQLKMSYEDIKRATAIDSKDLIPTLQSLALGKVRLLVKRPQGKDVLPTDEFLLNVKFEDKRRKIHVNTIQQQETAEENIETSRHIEQDRSYAIDAAVVRIMKGAKRLRFEDLKTRTVEGLKAHFVPNVSDIKKQIESLVTREYLERDEKDKGVYCYVA